MRIDQFVPAFHRGDAIGDEASHLKELFHSQGFESEIYCLTRDSGLEEESRLAADFPEPRPTDAVILHLALPSPMTQTFARCPCRRLLIYHNITPPHFFEGFSDELVRICSKGRKELESLVPHVSLALADSEYNRRELHDLGFRRTEVFPLSIDFEKYTKPFSPFMHDLFQDERTNILFVGRVAPNKKIEDLIKVIFFYKKYISPLVRLIVVGKTSSIPRYYQSLIRMADEFYLQPEEICFTGHVSDEEMFSLYRASDVFLSLSEHEGFGLPFVESMIFDLPIVAYDAAAVAFTLGEAGVLIRNKRVEYVAELVRLVTEDKPLREKIIQGQQERLRLFKESRQDEVLLHRIKEWTE